MSKSPDTVPTLFISHGAPTFALEPGELGDKLGHLGQTLVGVGAIVVVSPHWETHDLRVSSNKTPETIHDFYGFAPELYSLQYPANGSPEIATLIAEKLKSAGLSVSLDPHRGMDHGAWVPLRFLRPQADIPVVCVSLPLDATPESAWHLGKAMQPLRDLGILVLATGSLTHNLGEFRGPTVTDIQPYVIEFAGWMQDRLQNRDLADLLKYRTLAPHAVRAHPTQEHLLPLFVALGASRDDDAFDVISSEVRYGMLSMGSYHWH